MTEPKYDVAISFLSADESTASALYDALSDGLKVFFYPQNQKDVAGTNGLESMRMPFLDESRIVVVLYRESWGETPWTRTEQAAIQDGCLKYGWQRLFFVMLDKSSLPPKWLPHTHIRYNYADYGLEQAVGAIKARVQDAGGTLAPITAVKHAELSAQETQYLKEREELRTPSGLKTVRENTLKLFEAIGAMCREINNGGTPSIEIAADERQCHLRSTLVSLLVIRSDSDSHPGLQVREFDKRLAFPRQCLMYPDGDPKVLGKTLYLPDMNRAREYGWSTEQAPSDFLSVEGAANNIMHRFLDLHAKAARGQLRSKPQSSYGSRYR